jgi:hypothetical protein
MFVLVLLIGAIMNHIVEMGSGAMTYIPSFIQIGSAIQTLIGEYTYRHTVSKEISCLLSFSRNKESGLKKDKERAQRTRRGGGIKEY